MTTTIDDIVKHVRNTDGWGVDRVGQIRQGTLGSLMCPIESMAGKYNLRRAARHLHLSNSDRDIVMCAADGDPFSDAVAYCTDLDPVKYRNLRRRLLRAARAG